MKKLTFSIIAATLFSVKAFAQIPNSGFETWISMGSYSVPNGWGTMNNKTAASNIYTATKATPGNPGSSYLKLTSKTVGASVINGIAVSGKLDSTTMLPISGFAYNERPQSFKGKWQHMIYGSSQGSVKATLTRWDAGQNKRITVGTASQTLSGMAMSWASFTINFTYVDGDYPDSCIIVLKASGANPTASDYLWVDNLTFSGIVTGIEKNNISVNNISIYPNPAKGTISLDINSKSSQQTVIELTDLNGKIVLAKNTYLLPGETKQTLDISVLAKGAYLLKVINEEGTEIKKVILD